LRAFVMSSYLFLVCVVASDVNPSLIFIPNVDNNATANMIKNNIDLSNFIIYNELEKIEKYLRINLSIYHMPAQTHGRARNGFHILANSRGRSTNLNQAPCDTDAACEKAYCCGPAIQPLGMKPQGCKRGLCSFTPNRGRKRALALGGIGSRSSIIKRAITRRVENRNQMPKNYVPSATRPRNATEWPTVNAICKNTQTCDHCTCCTITMTKNHPRNACLGTCQNNKKCCKLVNECCPGIQIPVVLH